MVAGALIRQFFVLRHRGQTRWGFILAPVVLLASVFVALMPKPMPAATANAPTFAEVQAIITTRCVACHAAQPTHAGFAQPPKGVVLETREQIASHAAKISETVASRYMPIGNLTQMTDVERARLAAWFNDALRK